MSSKCENLFPENKKPRFWDIHRRQKSYVAPPKNAKTFFPEIRNPDFGTSIGANFVCCTPQKHENLFLENKKPQFWDIMRPIWPFLAPFWPLFVPIFQYGLKIVFYLFEILAAFMVSRTCVLKSSAIYLVPRVFSQKGNGVTIFGHTFLSIFSEFF